MKVPIKIIKEIEIKYCQVRVNVRNWENSIIDGVPDEEGKLTPCREGDLWCPLINIDTGEIINWSRGITAKIHFKVCDEGSYYLQDEECTSHLSIEEDYVPNLLIPGTYGDYIIMDIDINGNIAQWKKNPDISEFYNHLG